VWWNGISVDEFPDLLEALAIWPNPAVCADSFDRESPRCLDAWWTMIATDER